MNAELTRVQSRAFQALLAAIVVVSLAPIVVTGIMGKVVPDSLIAVSDKTITGLIGVLGTLIGVMWQSRQRTTPDAPSGRPGDPVTVTEEGSR